MTEETIDEVKQAYALLFKAHGAVVKERDELASRVREMEGATTLLLRHFPTDTDLIEAGWSFTDTEVAMKAHETARAALASKEQP